MKDEILSDKNKLCDQTDLEKKEATKSLVCNIPEHHKLEDINHQLKSYIRELRLNQEDDLRLSEKRAEFEALDLAINDRKQQLLNLEMCKNIRIHHFNEVNENLLHV